MPPPPDPGQSRRSADDSDPPTHGYGPKTASEPLLLSDRIVGALDLLPRNFDILLRVERQGAIGIIRLASVMQLLTCVLPIRTTHNLPMTRGGWIHRSLTGVAD